MAGRSFGYNYNSSPSPFSFGSNYINGPSYHHVSSGIYSPPSSSRTTPSFLSSAGNLRSSSASPLMSSFNLPRPKPISALRTHHMPTPTRIIKPSHFVMPSISETRATPPPPSSYRPFIRTTPIVPPAPAPARINVRDTANIDVVTRPKSRLLEMAEQVVELYQEDNNVRQGGIQRDYTVGTLRRGRKVIRLQTTRLPSIEAAKPPPPEPVKIAEPVKPVEPEVRTRPALQPYVAHRPQKKTPGERMKEKFLLPSRKGVKKFPPATHPPSVIPPPVQPPPPPPPVVVHDSGLGSSPVVTSFRDAKSKDGQEPSSRTDRKQLCWASSVFFGRDLLPGKSFFPFCRATLSNCRCGIGAR